MTTGEVIEVLRNIGVICGETIAKVWQPSGKTVQDMVKDIYRFIFDNKSIEIKKSEKGTLRIIDPECRLCWEGLEEEEINYCRTISSFIETIINKTRAGFVFLPKIRVTTLQSRATGAENCVHLIEFE